MILFELIGAALLEREFAGYATKAQRAVARALNRGITAGQTFMASSVAKDAGLKVRDVKAKMRARTATAAKPEATLATNLKRIPLAAFGAKGPTPSRGRGRGVSYRIGRMGRKTLPHAFIATVRRAGTSDFHSGHTGVFGRVGASRLPIKQKYGPSLGQVFARYRADALARAHAQFAKTIDHELSRLAPTGGGA